MTRPAGQVVTLSSYTRGVPYLRDQIDPVTKQELFKELIHKALTTQAGLIDWWAQKDQVVALWADWFAPHVSNPALSTISPIVKGMLNDDPAQVAYAFQYGNASFVIAWFKDLWQPQYQAIGMPGIQVNSPGGASRILGLIPSVAEAVDLGSELMGGALGWDSFAGPLSRYLLGNLVVLARNWSAGTPATAAELTATIKSETQKTLSTEGKPTSDSNLNKVIGEGPGKIAVQGETATDLSATETIAGSTATLAEGDAAVSVAGLEAAPSLTGLLVMALFTYVPRWLQGKLQYIDLRLEAVSSIEEDVSWTVSMPGGGVTLQVPNDAVIPGVQRLMKSDSLGTRPVLASHAAQFEFQNDARGSQPLELILDLAIGNETLVAVVFISETNLSMWVGPRVGTDTDQSLMTRCTVAAQPSYETTSGITVSINVATDPRTYSPPIKGSTVQTYSALIHLSKGS